MITPIYLLQEFTSGSSCDDYDLSVKQIGEKLNVISSRGNDAPSFLISHIISGKKVKRIGLKAPAAFKRLLVDDHQHLLADQAQHDFDSALAKLEKFIGEDQKKHKENRLAKPVLCVFTDRPDVYLAVDAIQFTVGEDCLLSKIILVHTKGHKSTTHGLFDEQCDVEKVHTDGNIAARFCGVDSDLLQNEDLVEIESTENEVFSFDPDSKKDEAGEKLVFLTVNKRHAIGLYKDHTTDKEGHTKKVTINRADRLKRLNNVISEGEEAKENAPEIAESICWPVGIIDEKKTRNLESSHWSPERIKLKDNAKLINPLLGVIMPAIPEEFIFQRKIGEPACVELRYLIGRNRCEKFTGKKWLLNKTALNICKNLAVAVDQIHTAGLRHTDLSWRNVLADHNTGKVYIIDVDSCHAASMQKRSAVLGTHGFLAPELARRKIAIPTVESDLFALAKLNYGTLMFDGKNEPDGYGAWSSRFFLGTPDSEGNLCKPGEMDEERFGRLGGVLEELFVRAFKDGWDDPDKRPTAGLWAEALASLKG